MFFAGRRQSFCMLSVAITVALIALPSPSAHAATPTPHPNILWLSPRTWGLKP